MQEDEVDAGGRPVCLVGLHTVRQQLLGTYTSCYLTTRDDCAGSRLLLGEFRKAIALLPCL